MDHSPFGPFAPDRGGVIALFEMFFEAFPDLHADIHEQDADGDHVITPKTFHGTHQGLFMGIPGTSNPVAFDVIDIVTVRDGRMRDHRNVVDGLARMTGVGAVPAMR